MMRCIFLLLGLLLPIATGFCGTTLRPTRTAVSNSRLVRGRKETVALGASSRAYDECDVAVMGGGFGGLYTALQISRESKKKGKNLNVALVDPSDRFVFLPLLYDLTMGTASEGEVCPTFNELLEGTGVRHIRASFDGFSKSSANNNGPSEAVLTTVCKPVYPEEEQESGDSIYLSFDAAVVAVGATPQSILASIPGASELAQPFYTKEDAYATRELLFRMDQKVRQGESPRIAVVGGGYGGVELSACVARRLPKARVTMMSRGPPMAGTKAEPLVEQALKKLGVDCEMNDVLEIQKEGNNKFVIKRSNAEGDNSDNDIDDLWDAVLWTAGSGPSYPIANDVDCELALSSSGRLRVDKSMRCSFKEEKSAEDASKPASFPSVWALGDCSEIVPASQPATPRTAQAAMQQADVVASNVLANISNRKTDPKTFEFQDLGSMLSLGGPNAAILGPDEDSQIGSLLVPLLDTARVGLGVADSIFAGIVNSPQIDKNGDLKPVVENLGLSLGGYGLGVDPETTPGTLSGTLSGAGRRAVYALRMPTNKQRAYAGASAFLSSALALAKEASDQIEKSSEKRR
ncbi:unnamed protein product [Pseudo-nitzschia multistriata]|uniref:FAD/NAD(P)-binding domain-containing protein n=1 Tax=Pseudo-nitzschia multistriata TaxID=183589 RepID=A0A448ZNI6_9STRA|nr:unnamed protein product [Pseudo-nitzschia multistriata]